MHLEGAAAATLAVFLYQRNHVSWGLFALLFLVPDLFMVGYLANPRVGAAIYNAVHTYVGPVVLALYSVGTDQRAVLPFSLIWIAHIGFDRMLGFGLKYPTRFKDTHLNPERHALEPGKAAT
jgi:hypothetical protein